MKKIPTLFVRDETRAGHPVTPVVTPGCEWVLAGEGLATEKVDGTNVKVEGGQLCKRQKPKARDYDEASYVPCRRDDPADQYAWEAWDRDNDAGRLRPLADGIYELIGAKVQGNAYGHRGHLLLSVVPPLELLHIAELPDRTFATLRAFLELNRMEGIVFHHPDGRFAKIKRRDFGLPWPLPREELEAR